MTPQERQLARQLDRIDRSAHSHATQTLAIFNAINESVETAQDTMEASGTEATKLMILSASNITNANENAIIRDLTPTECVRVLATVEARLTQQAEPINDLTTKEDTIATLLVAGYQLAQLEEAPYSPNSPHVMTPQPDGTVVVTASPEPEE